MSRARPQFGYTFYGMTEPEPLLQFFAFDHLPPLLRDASEPFAVLAHRIVETFPRNPERTVCLRKLLEAKDCGVRCVLQRRAEILAPPSP